MPVKPIPAYVSEHINEDNVNILDVLDDVKFANLLGRPLTKIKSMFPSHSSAFESLSKTHLQIEAGDEKSYVRVCEVFTNVSLEVHKLLCEELQASGSCYIVSTCLY